MSLSSDKVKYAKHVFSDNPKLAYLKAQKGNYLVRTEIIEGKMNNSIVILSHLRPWRMVQR